MRKDLIIFFLGLFVIILPFLGLAPKIEAIAISLLGLIIVGILSSTFFKEITENKKFFKHTNNSVFVENHPLHDTKFKVEPESSENSIEKNEEKTDS